MTKLYKYILNESSIREMEKDDVLSLVTKKCRPILKEMKDYFLFRMNKNNIIAGIGKTYKDRNPTDTPINLHKIVDDYFKEKFGWKARSENVLFVYGKRMNFHGMDSKLSTVEYNLPSFIVFPIGKFEYIWSPKIKDLTVSLNDAGIYRTDDGNIYEFMKEAEYRNNGFNQAIKSGNEIMIKCKEYYMINLYYILMREIRKLL